VLVVSQVALSLTLLVGALLFARSLNNLAGVDAGFRQTGILISDIDFSGLNLAKYARIEFGNEVLRRVRAIPGVDSAATTMIVPLSGNGMGHDILLGQSGEPEDEPPIALFHVVSPGFFETMQTRLLAGRDFNDHDTANSPKVAIVSEAFAKQFAKGENPLGMKFRVRRMQSTTLYEVVGLVKDTKYFQLREQFEPIVYTALAQFDRPQSDTQIMMRSNAPLLNLIFAVKTAVSEMNPNIDISFSNFHQAIQEGLIRDRLMATLSGFFGLLAVLLAVIGLYGVMSYMVAQRRSEIAIRMALGAGRANILKLVMGESGTLLAVGLVIGIGLTIAGGRAATALLFGLKPTDPITLATALLSLSLAATLASVLPARRAARNEPMQALRNE
jgi:predicted permease